MKAGVLYKVPQDSGRNSSDILKVEVKVKVTPKQATKAQRGSRCTALLFLQPRCYMGVGGQHHASAVLPPRKTRYPLYRRLGGLQGRSGRVWKISSPTGIRLPDRPASSESLYRLSYRGFSFQITEQNISCCLRTVNCYCQLRST